MFKECYEYQYWYWKQIYLIRQNRRRYTISSSVWINKENRNKRTTKCAYFKML